MKKLGSFLTVIILIAAMIVDQPISVKADFNANTIVDGLFSSSHEDEESDDKTEETNKQSLKDFFEEKTGEAGKVLDAAKEKTSKMASKAGELSENVKEHASDAGKKVAEATGKAKDTIIEKGKKATDYASDKASELADNAKKATSSFANQAKELLNSFDKESFKKGWDRAANLISTNAASVATYLKDQAFIDSVSNEIQRTREAIYEQAVKNGPKASRAGFVAEEWHAGSFNASAKAADIADYASTPNSTKAASVDIEVRTASGEIENYSLKYYKDGASSASEQAKNFMQKYNEYASMCKKNGNEPKTQEEYLSEYASYNDMSSMYDSVYKGQKRLIPAGQEEEAARKLKEKIAKEASKSRESSSGLIAGYEDTLSNLTATVTNADGTVSSVPLAKEDAEKIVELCKSDPDAFKPEDFGLSTAQLIPMSHIANLAIQGGAQAAIINVAFEMGPELFQIIKQLVETGELDQDALKESGLGALEGSKGFIEGTVSTAILECCKIGKFGPAFTDVNPSIVGALTVLTVDAAIYSYQLNNGQISSSEYADYLTEEIFVTAVSLGTGTLVQVLLPMIPGAYFAGSIAGSLLASTGYAYGKELVLAVIDNGGLDMIVPVKIDGVTALANNFLTVDLSEILSPFKGLKIDKNQDLRIIMLNFLKRE